MPIAAITSQGKTVLLVVAITFIAWAIITAIFVPKSNPAFPRRLDAYILVSALLFVCQMSAVVWVTGTQEVEEEAHAAAEGGGGTTTEPGTATQPGTTTEASGTTTGPATTGDATAGKQVFASAGCTACHTLADANATGTVGPNLDEAKPPASLVVDRVTHGKGAMPSFEGQLTETQIQDVAAYVSSVAGTS
jgi:mono/diheme cytochrome c family protein